MDNDIKQLSLDVIRDLHGSSRRLNMYPLGHPITQEMLKKPLSGLNSIFHFKHSFVLELFRDRILAEGILLDDSVFVSGMALDMKKHQLSNVIFNSSIAIGDLYHFLSVLISRPGPHDDNVDRILKGQNVTAVTVNSNNICRLFHFDGGTLPGSDRFLLDGRIDAIIARQPSIIGSYYMGRLNDDDDLQRELGIDLRLSYMAQHFRQVLLKLDSKKGMALIEEAILSTNWLDDTEDSRAVSGLRRLFDDFLSENADEQVLSTIYRLLKNVGAPENIMSQVVNKSSFLKLKTIQECENIIAAIKSSELSKIDPAVLKKTVFKLAASRQQIFLNDIIDHLIKSLLSEIGEERHEAVKLLKVVAEILVNSGFFNEYTLICKETIRLSLLPTETLEPVELLAELIWLGIRNSRWPEFKALARTLRGVCDDRVQSSSKREIAALRISEFSHSDILFRTASDLSEQSKSDDANDFFKGLSQLGSKEIIKMLAGKLTHPDINIRSRMIKILVSMKGDAARILIEMLNDVISRVKIREISEDDWYYYRNMLRVLREIHAADAIPCLEIMASWPEPRLRLEIVKTLEGMPAVKAEKLFVRLARDENPEVRKAAVVAIGLSGDSVMIPHLLEIFEGIPECRAIAAASLGRIGGAKARDHLIRLMEDASIYRRLEISKRDSEEIKATIIKALSLIGDNTAISKVAEYSAKAPDKSLFRSDLLSNTAKIILGSKIR